MRAGTANSMPGHTVFVATSPRSRRYRAMLLGGLALASLASACISFEGDDDEATTGTPYCTPPPGQQAHVTMHVTDAAAFDGHPVSMRLLLPIGYGLLCTSSMVPASGTFDISGDAGGVLGGMTLELVLSSDGNPAYSAGDLTRTFTLGVDGTETSEGPCSVNFDWDLAFSATDDTAGAVTWELGLACPGETL